MINLKTISGAVRSFENIDGLTCRDLKTLLAPHSSPSDIILSFQGEVLSDDLILSTQFGDRDIIDQAYSLCAGGYSDAGSGSTASSNKSNMRTTFFNNLEKEEIKEFGKEAPDWCVTAPGMNLMATC